MKAAKVGPLDELEVAVETLEGGLAEIHATEVYSSTYLLVRNNIFYFLAYKRTTAYNSLFIPVL